MNCWKTNFKSQTRVSEIHSAALVFIVRFPQTYHIDSEERLRERAKNARAEFLPHFFPSFAFATNPAGERSDHRSLSQWSRFEKDRELEDAIIRKRKSQLVPPQRDAETRATRAGL